MSHSNSIQPTIESLRKLSMVELRQLSTDLGLPMKSSRLEFVDMIHSQYLKLKMYIHFTYIRQLGVRGKDGRVFLARDDKGQHVAVKCFDSTKSTNEIRTEVELQMVASAAGIAPQIIEFDADARYVAMEPMKTTLYDLFCAQDGQLTSSQQQQVIDLCDRLDDAGVFHNDPNPLNFMFSQDDIMYVIDYGMAKPINASTRRRYGRHPNRTYLPIGLGLKLREIHPAFDGSDLMSGIHKKKT